MPGSNVRAKSAISALSCMAFGLSQKDQITRNIVGRSAFCHGDWSPRIFASARRPSCCNINGQSTVHAWQRPPRPILRPRVCCSMPLNFQTCRASPANPNAEPHLPPEFWPKDLLTIMKACHPVPSRSRRHATAGWKKSVSVSGGISNPSHALHSAGWRPPKHQLRSGGAVSPQ